MIRLATNNGRLILSLYGLNSFPLKQFYGLVLKLDYFLEQPFIFKPNYENLGEIVKTSKKY